MAKYVAYYRVRRRRGLDRNAELCWQRTAVENLLSAGDELIDEFTEDETQRHRRHFEGALTSASRHRAILVIPKFRRICGTPAFLDRLRDTGVDFIALNMPTAKPTTIAALATEAAYRRRAISERIKMSLQAAKARGRALGNPELARIRARAVQTASDLAREQRQALRFEVLELRANGRSLRAIANELNQKGIPTARGREWHASSVRKILAEVGDPTA